MAVVLPIMHTALFTLAKSPPTNQQSRILMDKQRDVRMGLFIGRMLEVLDQCGIIFIHFYMVYKALHYEVT